MVAYVKQLPCSVTHSGLLRINFDDTLSASGVQAIYLYFSLNPCNPAKLASLQSIYYWNNYISGHRYCVHIESNALVIAALLLAHSLGKETKL